MKRTVRLKAIALFLCILCWILWPINPALVANLVILSVTLIALTIPVLNPRSSFYVPTHSSVRDGSDRVALTFDDGPDPHYTPKILDYLDAEGIRAAFFVVGFRVEQHPDLIRAIVERGHVIGNHSYRHGFNFHFLSPQALNRDLDDFDSIMMKTIGRRCLLFRSPQGFRTPLLADVLRSRNLACIGWQARGLDSVRSNVALILKSILKNLSGGCIVLLHDGAGLGGRAERNATLETLPLLVGEVRARGLQFERLDTLIGMDAYA